MIVEVKDTKVAAAATDKQMDKAAADIDAKLAGAGTSEPGTAEGADPSATDTAPDPVADLAKQLGWNPDFAGDGAVDAKTFILRSRDISDGLSKKVRTLTKQLSAVQEGVDAVRFASEQSHAKEVARLKSEISELKSQRTTAIKDGDVDAVDALDGKIKVLQDATKAPAAPAPKTPAVHPAYEEWIETNEWYVKDPTLQAYVDTLIATPENQALAKADYPRLLSKVSRMAKAEFPDRFATKPAVAAAKPAALAADTSPAVVQAAAAHAPVSPSRQRVKGAKPKATAGDLNYEQRNVGKDFVARGVFKTLDDYAQSLAEMSAPQQSA